MGLKIQVVKKGSVGEDGKLISGCLLFHSNVEQGGSEVYGTGLPYQPEFLVCLSRVKPGSCMFPVTDLQNHDHHAPKWNGDGDGAHDLAAMEAYSARVQQDVVDACSRLEAQYMELKEKGLPIPTKPAPQAEEADDNE